MFVVIETTIISLKLKLFSGGWQKTKMGLN